MEMVQVNPQINAGKDYIRRLRRFSPIKTDFIKILFALQKNNL
jgi:hypothetical protein